MFEFEGSPDRPFEGETRDEEPAVNLGDPTLPIPADGGHREDPYAETGILPTKEWVLPPEAAGQE